MATKKQPVQKQIKEALQQPPKVEEVEVKLKYEVEEKLEDVNKHKWKYSMRGQVPDELKGLFTRKDRILTIAKQRGIEVEETV